MVDTTALPPNPGSDAAIALGCTCAVLDNAHGRGYMGRPGVFVFTCGCPVHDPAPTDAGRAALKASAPADGG